MGTHKKLKAPALLPPALSTESVCPFGIDLFRPVVVVLNIRFSRRETKTNNPKPSVLNTRWLRKLRLPCAQRLGVDTQPFGHLTDRISTLNDLPHSVLLELIRKPNSLTNVRLSLVPKLPSKRLGN